jgi:hypothetical protein
MGNVDEREGMAEGNSDDVEGHGLLDKPAADQPAAERNDEGDDVEAHGLVDRPNVDSPNAD